MHLMTDVPNMPADRIFSRPPSPGMLKLRAKIVVIPPKISKWHWLGLPLAPPVLGIAM